MEQWVSYLTMIGVGAWGGLVSYLHRVFVSGGADTPRKPFVFFELVAELMASGFTGLMVYSFCLAINVSEMLILFIVGVSGHAGARTLFLLERIALRYLERHFDDSQS